MNRARLTRPGDGLADHPADGGEVSGEENRAEAVLRRDTSQQVGTARATEEHDRRAEHRGWSEKSGSAGVAVLTIEQYDARPMTPQGGAGGLVRQREPRLEGEGFEERSDQSGSYRIRGQDECGSVARGPFSVSSECHGSPRGAARRAPPYIRVPEYWPRSREFVEPA